MAFPPDTFWESLLANDPFYYQELYAYFIQPAYENYLAWRPEMSKARYHRCYRLYVENWEDMRYRWDLYHSLGITYERHAGQDTFYAVNLLRVLTFQGSQDHWANPIWAQDLSDPLSEYWPIQFEIPGFSLELRLGAFPQWWKLLVVWRVLWLQAVAENCTVYNAYTGGPGGKLTR